MPGTRVYFDSGSGAPMTPRVRDAVRAGLTDGWADPSRLGAQSRQSRALIESSKAVIADALGARQEWVHFVPGFQLGIERVIAGIFTARRGANRVVLSAIERDVTAQAAHFVAADAVDYVPVDHLGHVSIDTLAAALAQPGVALAGIQHSNQELGTLQDLSSVWEATQSRSIPLVVDATSSLGHTSIPEHWDAIVANAADWGGPRGIGVVALKPQTRYLPAWPEGDDWGVGAISAALALGAAVALQERQEQAEATSARLRELVDVIRAGVAAIDGVEVLGDPVNRLPHVVTFSCLYVHGEALLTALDREGFTVGSGSACATGTLEPSRVLAAIGALTHGNVRIALHPGNTRNDVDRFLAVLPKVIADVRSGFGAAGL